MNCQCVGCTKKAQGAAQEYCDYHAALSEYLGADFKTGSRYE